MAWMELAVWTFWDFGFVLKSDYFPYRILPGFSLLVLLYLIVPAWVFGSIGWGRHIGSYLVGPLLATGILFSFMHMAHLPGFNELTDQGIESFCLATIKHFPHAFLVTIVFYFLRRDSPRGNRFFLFVMIRELWVAAILGGSIWLINR